MSPMDEVELHQALLGLAHFTRAYYQACLAEGFSADAALTLAVAWQTTTQAASEAPRRDEEDG